ncbi:MAG: hypothetical protein AVDCRST_MAG49-3703 [uncultured Thermomicrobiales bacterium]|uniref:Uncharacterized protein n=1 Tax=uncultured Thermomicrobiales bacterium TaxID=1645740 RepID=A0A6J4VBX3_9BACT|nr:MAG: hypothetical protein AVDCRST_MAG49-3703 [uncultured Thermomicrobiales bacterium]
MPLGPAAVGTASTGAGRGRQEGAALGLRGLSWQEELYKRRPHRPGTA